MTDTAIQSNVLFIYSITMRAEDISHFKITNMPREEKNKNAHFHKTQKRMRLVVPFVCDSQRGSHLHILLSFLSLFRSLCGCLFPSLPRNGHNLHMCSLTFRHNKIQWNQKTLEQEKLQNIAQKCHWHQHDAQMIWTDERIWQIPVRYPPSSKLSNLKQFVFQMTFAINLGDPHQKRK